MWSKPIRRIKNVKTDDGIIRTVYSSLQLCFLRLLHRLCLLHLFCFVCGSFLALVCPKQSFFFHCQTAIRTNLFANTLRLDLLWCLASLRFTFPFQFSPVSLATLQCIRAYKASPCCLPSASLSHSLFWGTSLQFECVENYLLHSSDNRIA